MSLFYFHCISQSLFQELTRWWWLVISKVCLFLDVFHHTNHLSRPGDWPRYRLTSNSEPTIGSRHPPCSKDCLVYVKHVVAQSAAALSFFCALMCRYLPFACVCIYIYINDYIYMIYTWWKSHCLVTSFRIWSGNFTGATSSIAVEFCQNWSW